MDLARVRGPRGATRPLTEMKSIFGESRNECVGAGVWKPRQQQMRGWASPLGSREDAGPPCMGVGGEGGTLLCAKPAPGHVASQCSPEGLRSQERWQPAPLRSERATGFNLTGCGPCVVCSVLFPVCDVNKLGTHSREQNGTQGQCG